MAFITTQCDQAAELDPHSIGPEDSCFDLPLDQIRELLAELGDRPEHETTDDIHMRLETVTRVLEQQESDYRQRLQPSS